MHAMLPHFTFFSTNSTCIFPVGVFFCLLLSRRNLCSIRSLLFSFSLSVHVSECRVQFPHPYPLFALLVHVLVILLLFSSISIPCAAPNDYPEGVYKTSMCRNRGSIE